MRSLSAALALLSTLLPATAEPARPTVDLPPVGYTGQTFTDGNGCVFVRLDVDGQGTIWVQKLDETRRPDCNDGAEPLRVARNG